MVPSIFFCWLIDPYIYIYICIYYFLGLVCLWKKWMYNRRIFIVWGIITRWFFDRCWTIEKYMRSTSMYIYGVTQSRICLRLRSIGSSEQISSILIYNLRGNIFHLFSYYMIYRRTCVLCIFERVLDHRLSFDSLLCD